MEAAKRVISSTGNTSYFTVLLSTFVAIFLGICIHDYIGWLRLGPGGLPHSLHGWLRQWHLQLTLARRDTVSVHIYATDLASLSVGEGEKARAKTRYVKSIPQRTGSRPKVAHWVVPHRQAGSEAPSTIITRVSAPHLPSNEDHNLVFTLKQN